MGDVRRDLAEALAAHQTTRGMRVSMGWTCACGWWSPDQSRPLILAHQVDALMPVVERIVREAKAEALRGAADGERDIGGWAAAERLRARADAATGGEG